MATLEAHTDTGRKTTSDSQTRLVLRRLFGKNAVILCVAFLALTLLCALVPGLVSPHDPFAQELILRLKPPSFLDGGVEGFWLGTDHLGRDTLSRIIYGARVTLVVSVLAVAVSLVAGVAAGLVAGFYGGRTDAVILRLIDMQLAFPVILLVIAVVAVVGPSLTNLIIIMGLSGWPRSRPPTPATTTSRASCAARSCPCAGWNMSRQRAPSAPASCAS